ncbi:MAG: LEA type 2 family protein [Methanoregula sp.]|jgi:LEA14-like dessication related protein|nr:LEA type 2 family protein [Methanoregula sp.]
MELRLHSGIFLVFVLILLTAGCTQPALKDPVVTVGEISLSDVSLDAMTVNTTVNIFNPNPVGADLKKIGFDVWYLDDAPHYLGHGEQTNISVKENGNTSLTIPVKIGTVQAAQGVGSLLQKGSLLVRVNGSAVIDLRLTSYEKPFEQTREFQRSEFESLLPATIPGTDINVSEGIEQLGGLLGSIS